MTQPRITDCITHNLNLSEEEKDNLVPLVKVRKYLKGQFVVQAGDVCRYSSYVNSGALKTFYVDNKGNEHIVSFAIEKWWTGDYGSFIAQEPADYSVQCIENCELIQISRENYNIILAEQPKLETFFRQRIENAYVAMQRRIVDKNSLSVKENYFKFINRYPEIEQRFPQYMIASYLGASPEFISKIRKEAAAKKKKS